MIVTFYIKTWLSDYLVTDIIKIIQYNYYKLRYDLMYKSVLQVLNEYFQFDNINDKYHMKGYKKIAHDYHKGENFPLGYKWYDYVYYDFNHNLEYDYITINYKNVNNKYCIVIKVSSFYNVPAIKRLESRIMENTSYRMIKVMIK